MARASSQPTMPHAVPEIPNKRLAAGNRVTHHERMGDDRKRLGCPTASHLTGKVDLAAAGIVDDLQRLDDVLHRLGERVVRGGQVGEQRVVAGVAAPRSHRAW